MPSTREERVFMQSLAGRRVEVYWPMEMEWYGGWFAEGEYATPAPGSENEGNHCICYDDGDYEWIELRTNQDRVRVLDASGIGGTWQNIVNVVWDPWHVWRV